MATKQRAVKARKEDVLYELKKIYEENIFTARIGNFEGAWALVNWCSDTIIFKDNVVAWRWANLDQNTRLTWALEAVSGKPKDKKDDRCYGCNRLR